MIRYIRNEEHYDLLLEQIAKVKHTLRIGTADLKDLYVEKDVNKAIEMYKENDTFISRFALERLKVKE